MIDLPSTRTLRAGRKPLSRTSGASIRRKLIGRYNESVMQKLLRFSSVYLALVASSCLGASSDVAAKQEALANEFLNPPVSSGPRTWWHWLSNNVSKEGITKDLEAIRKGLGTVDPRRWSINCEGLRPYEANRELEVKQNDE